MREHLILLYNSYTMLEGVQYNTHCDWLIVGAIFPYYMYAYGFVQVMFPNAWPPGKRQTENVTMSHNYCFSLAQDCIWKLWPLIIVVQPRNRLWAFRLLLSPLCVMCKTTSGKNGRTKPLDWKAHEGVLLPFRNDFTWPFFSQGFLQSR